MPSYERYKERNKDDIYKVKLREKQWISDTGIKSEYEIVEVINHRSAAKQIKLPFEKNETVDGEISI